MKPIRRPRSLRGYVKVPAFACAQAYTTRKIAMTQMTTVKIAAPMISVPLDIPIV